MKTRIAEEIESIAFDRQVLARAFEDYLFGSNPGGRQPWSEPEETLYHQIAAHIEHQDRFSKYVPSAPTLLVQLMDALRSESSDFRKIQDIIKADPGLTGEIVRISNSPLYRPRSGEITSIDKAIAMLGFNEIMQVASSVMMRKLFNLDSTQYRRPAEKIWNHCQKSAEACLLLANGRHEFQSYLLGLIHEIGRISILSCFTAETADKDLKRVAEYSVISRLMKDYAPWLSSLIAAEWGLDDHYLVALGEFEKLCLGELSEEQYLRQSEATKTLNLGSQCSMIHSLSNDSRIAREDGVEVLLHNGLTEGSVTRIFTRFDLTEASIS